MDSSQEKEEMLIQAAGMRNVEWCRRLISDGVDVNGRGLRSGNIDSALSRAVSSGNPEIVEVLLLAGADVTYSLGEEQGGGGLLHIAALTGNVEVCRLLVGAGADKDKRDATGCTPLHDAARFGSAAVFEVLIQASADPCTFDHDDSSPLRSAAGNGHVSICRLLVDAGISPSLAPVNCSVDYLTPMQQAVENGRGDVVRYFHEECGEDLEQIARDGRSLTTIAEASRSVSEYLLSARVQTEVAEALSKAHEERHASRTRTSGMSPL